MKGRSSPGLNIFLVFIFLSVFGYIGYQIWVYDFIEINPRVVKGSVYDKDYVESSTMIQYNPSTKTNMIVYIPAEWNISFRLLIDIFQSPLISNLLTG